VPNCGGHVCITSPDEHSVVYGEKVVEKKV